MILRKRFYLDVPWLIPDSKEISFGITDFNIAEIFELSVYCGPGKFISKIVHAKADLSYVKITDAVI